MQPVPDICERLWCNRCQQNTEHARPRVSGPLQFASCLTSPLWWFMALQTGMAPRNTARCTICGRAHSGRVVKKRNPP
jgi:hypothetical protein